MGSFRQGCVLFPILASGAVRVVGLDRLWDGGAGIGINGDQPLVEKPMMNLTQCQSVPEARERKDVREI